MKIVVNGQSLETAATTVAALVQEYCANAALPTRVAVVLNGEVVPATTHTQSELREGDAVELLAFAGGG